MNREEKTARVEEIASQIKEAEALFAVDYRGISVAQIAELRSTLRDAGASFRIVKNSLTERAADAAGAEPLKGMLEGPTALTLISGDVALAAKALADFSRANDLLDFKGGLMDGSPIEVEQIRALARLPARDVLQARFVGILASPLTTLVRGLGSMVAGLAVALKQIEEQGLVGGDASEAGAEPVEEAEAAPVEPEQAEDSEPEQADSEPEETEDSEPEQAEDSEPEQTEDVEPEQTEDVEGPAPGADSQADKEE